MKIIITMVILLMGNKGSIQMDETHVMVNYGNEAVAILENQGECEFSVDGENYETAEYWTTVACLQ